MIFSENRFTLFRIMLWDQERFDRIAAQRARANSFTAQDQSRAIASSTQSSSGAGVRSN
jgi:hypothetical protein